MAVYPPQLTTEEKNLKKRYARLLEKRKLLRKLQEKPPPSLLKSSSAKPASAEALSPKDAMAAAKKLLEAGKLKLGKKTPAKRTGFKRVGETPGEVPPSKKAATSTHGGDTEDKQMLKKKKADQINYQRDLYKKTFVRPSFTGDMELQRIPKKQEEDEKMQTESLPSKETTATLKERTVHVHCQYSTMSEEALTRAFSRFGTVEKTELLPSKKSSFVTFIKASCARKAIEEMNRGMIRGYEVSVEEASEKNNFVDLPPESHVWAKIAAGKELPAGTGSPSKKPSSHRSRAQQSYSDINSFLT